MRRPAGCGREQRPDEECEASEGVYNCWMEGCIVPCTTQMLRVFGTFCIVAMASNTFGNLLSSIGFPAITVFLAFGVRRRAIRPRNSARNFRQRNSPTASSARRRCSPARSDSTS